MQLRNFKVGPGPVIEFGDHVTVHYQSTSLHGRLIENSEVNFPAGVNFIAGSDAVPPVLSEGVIGMRVGGRREIVAPPSAHFPDQLRGQILMYDINVVGGRKKSEMI